MSTSPTFSRRSPFAILTWTALVPVLVCVVAVPIAPGLGAGGAAIRSAR